MNAPDTEIQFRLQDYYRQAFPEQKEAQILELTPLNLGWESIIYAFKVVIDPHSSSQPQSLILRLYPGTDAHAKSQREFAGLQVLHQLGYPVPRVFRLERENSPFGKPFILMEKIEGEILWYRLDQSSPEQKAALLDQFCALFVQLHQLDWQPFIHRVNPPNQPEPYQYVNQFLKMINDATRQFPDLQSFIPVLEWLRERRDKVPCARPAPVHWDFHPGNVILRPDGKMTVIDWTQIQVSDPRFDLGWTLLLVGAYNGDEPRQMILSEYQRHVGMEIGQLEFFDVANALKRLGSVLISLFAGADQMGMRPDAIENMRRDFPALQRVYDLLVVRTGIRIREVETLLSG